MSDSEEDNTSENLDWPVTEEWLQKVLKEHHKTVTEPSGITIIQSTVRPGCDTGESILSDILAVTVTYCVRGDPEGRNHTLNLIVKLLPQDPFSRFFVTEAQFDLREIKFYNEVVPDLLAFGSRLNNDNPEETLSLPIPKCYYAHYSSGELEPVAIPPSSVLVLENIRTSGFRCICFSSGLNLDEMKAAIKSLAKIHSLSLCSKIIDGQMLSEKYPFLFQTAQASESYQQLVERGLPQLFEFLETKNELKDIMNELNDLRPHTKDILECMLRAEEPMALIIHTDFWCNNLMFRVVDGVCECKILDWQMVTYSRPTNDLALLLVSSVAADLRRQYSESMLDLYWETMTEMCRNLGVDIEGSLNYNRQKLGEDYRRAQLLALLLCIGSVDLALGNAQMEERLIELLKDLHKEKLLNVNVCGLGNQK